jgi:hypothetical protein
MSTQFKLALLGLLPAAAIFWWVDVTHRQQEKELAALRSALKSLSATESPRDARQAVSAWQAPYFAPASTGSPATTAARQSGETRDDPGGIDSGAPADREGGEIRDRLEEAFVMDHGASEWVGASKQEALQKLTHALPQGSRLRSFECHERVCRIESSHQNQASYRQFVGTAFMAPTTQLWNGGFYSAIETSRDGEIMSVTYLAQAGQNLPFQ